MQFKECSINSIKYQEINGKLVPEGMTEDSPDGSVPCLVRFIFTVCKDFVLVHAIDCIKTWT